MNSQIEALDNAAYEMGRAGVVQKQAVESIEEQNTDLSEAVLAGQMLLAVINRDDSGLVQNPHNRTRIIDEATATLNRLVDKYAFDGKAF